jgi:hypothetical protein
MTINTDTPIVGKHIQIYHHGLLERKLFLDIAKSNLDLVLHLWGWTGLGFSHMTGASY